MQNCRRKSTKVWKFIFFSCNILRFTLHSPYWIDKSSCFDKGTSAIFIIKYYRRWNLKLSNQMLKKCCFISNRNFINLDYLNIWNHFNGVKRSFPNRHIYLEVSLYLKKIIFDVDRKSGSQGTVGVICAGSQCKICSFGSHRKKCRNNGDGRRKKPILYSS